MKGEWLHLVTGKLAATALQEVVEPISRELGFSFTIDVLPITVAGLMTPRWVAKHMEVPPQATRVVLPGYCVGDLDALKQRTTCELTVGPKDLRELPEFLGAKSKSANSDYGAYDIQIIAEINHRPAFRCRRLSDRRTPYERMERTSSMWAVCQARHGKVWAIASRRSSIADTPCRSTA